VDLPRETFDAAEFTVTECSWDRLERVRQPAGLAVSAEGRVRHSIEPARSSSGDPVRRYRRTFRGRRLPLLKAHYTERRYEAFETGRTATHHGPEVSFPILLEATARSGLRRAETPVRGPRRCREPLVQAALS